ncbi:conserved hypothetical protein [Paecilomyces variotii No. 5]|uniref:Nicotinamide-nucleotide adenylyltransferase n=1 Tax=Byssochlamys spectabilis (strain No. 5 / NBRC 109023) TaxID=1356009 RepID=V5G8P9_BYSSN|nr:conserved hypothetical protein [Paecilomyces variotii No. 5]
MASSTSSCDLVPASELRPEKYHFPPGKLQRCTQSGKTPLILVACGSYSPPTFLHLRMFSMASDFARMNTEFEVVGGYLSPVSDAYEKTGLVTAVHRIHMCQLAVQTSKWINMDPWEAIQPEYVPTAKVLDHFEYEINSVLGGIEDASGSGKRLKARIALLAGADLIETMSSPDLWTEADLQHILGDFGVFVVERAGTDLNDALTNLKKWQHNIHRIPQVVPNEISSTKIRNLLKQRMSVEYLIPKGVIEYIEENRLYMNGEEKEGGSGDERRDGRK